MASLINELNRRPVNAMQMEILNVFGRTSEIPTHLVINTLCNLKVLTDKPSNQNELIDSIILHGVCAYWMFRHILCQLNCHIPQMKYCKEMFFFIWLSKMTGKTLFRSLELYEDEDDCLANGLIEKTDYVSCCLEIIPVH